MDKDIEEFEELIKEIKLKRNIERRKFNRQGYIREPVREPTKEPVEKDIFPIITTIWLVGLLIGNIIFPILDTQY